jgi:hypothetical protein
MPFLHLSYDCKNDNTFSIFTILLGAVTSGLSINNPSVRSTLHNGGLTCS